MANQTGIAIVIKAFLPTGKTLDEQYAALTIVKTAHETSDYAALLKAATIEEVKTEQKTRRIDEQPQSSAPADQRQDGGGDQLDIEDAAKAKAEEDAASAKAKAAADADVPDFLKKDKKSKAA